MVKHKVLFTPKLRESTLKRDGSWFDIHGRLFQPVTHILMPEINTLSDNRIPNLEILRAVAAHYLGIASYPDPFYRAYKRDTPKPTEKDRKLYRDYIAFQLTMTGILNSTEVKKILDRGWWNNEIASIPAEFLFQQPIDLPDRSSVIKRIKSWKLNGWHIALFHGSFDPPTPTHLQNAMHAYLYSSVTGVPIKFVVGFDNDELIKRKGENRPRYSIDDRRTQFGRFWMVDETVELSPTKPEKRQFVQEYKDLGIDYVVITQNLDEVAQKYPAVLAAGIEAIPVHESPLPHASTLLESN